MKFWAFILVIFIYISTLAQSNGDKFQLKDIEIYANATNEILYLRHGELIDGYKIYDMSGKIVQRGEESTQIITILELKEGFYLLELHADNKMRTIRIKKF